MTSEKELDINNICKIFERLDHVILLRILSLYGASGRKASAG